MKNNLPAGWKSTTLSTVASIVRGIAFSSNDKSYESSSDRIACLRTANVQKKVKWDDLWFIPKSYVRDEKQIVTTGDILISLANSYELVGKVCQVQNVPTVSTLGAFISLIRAKEEIDSSFLYHYLNSHEVQSEIRKLASTTVNISNVSVGKISELEILLPPIAEQRRIVAQLDAVIQKLEASQERLDKLPDLLKKFRQAVLAAAVSGKLTKAWRAEQPQGETGADLLDRIRTERRSQWEEKQQAKLSGKQLSLNDSWKSKYEEPTTPDTSELLELPAGWTWATVEQLAKVGTGATPLKGNSDYYEGGLIPWVTSGALNNLLVTEAEEHITPLAVAETNAKIFPVGTLLVALYGEGKTRGKTSELAIEAATNQACAAIVFDLAATSIKDFVKLFFRKNYEDLRKLAAGGVQPNLNLGLIKTTRIPFPPLDEQQEIVRQVNHYFGLADQLETRFEQAAALVEQLPQALLAKAFSGQLVSQDPDDEPAGALLERLQAEPAAPVKGKRGRKAKVAGEVPLFE